MFNSGPLYCGQTLFVVIKVVPRVIALQRLPIVSRGLENRIVSPCFITAKNVVLRILCMRLGTKAIEISAKIITVYLAPHRLHTTLSKAMLLALHVSENQFL